MFSKKTKETAFFIVAIVLLWLIFNRQIRGFFANISRQLNITPPVEQPPVEQPPVEQPPVEQPPVVQPPVVQPPVVQPPLAPRPVLPPIPNIPRLQMGFFTWDRLPWERNRTRIEVMEAIRSDMRRIKSFPYSVASTFPEVIGAGGVVPYLNAQIRRFNAAATASILIAGAPVPRPPDSASGLVQAVQRDEEEEIEWGYAVILPYFPATNGRGGGDGGRVGGGYFAGFTP